MKTTTPLTHPHLRPGLSALELTVMLAVLLGLISVLFVGIKAYKAGSDRAACVLNIHSVQNAVRSFSNLNGLVPGQAVAGNLKSELVGPDCFVDKLRDCPGGGSYIDLGNRIPTHGELYLNCSLAADERHQPQALHSW